MEGFKVAVILLILCSTDIKADDFDDELSVSLEERVSALETQVLVQSLKNKQAISRVEKKLLQKLETKGTLIDGENSDPNIIKRIDKIEVMIDKMFKIVGASVKGLSDEKAINRENIKGFTENEEFFQSSIEKRIDTLEEKLNLGMKENKSQLDKPLVSMIEYLNNTIEDLKNTAITSENKDLEQAIKQVETDCPENWIRIDSTCFLLVDDESVDWFSAALKCHEIDATLAEIKDAAMFDRLVQNMTTYTWVGGTDEEVEGVWIWIGSNTEITYFNWVKNQPNLLAVTQDCLEIWPLQRGFSDADCGAAGNYLCQKDLDHF